MQRFTTQGAASPLSASELPGETVPVASRGNRSPVLLTPAARKAARQRMLLLRAASLDRLASLAGLRSDELRPFRHELSVSELPDTLLDRGAGLAFARELPQGGLLYILVRALRPARIVETGVRPGYSTAWLLAALEANGSGELFSLGPGPTAGRSSGVHDVRVGQFVPPELRSHWTLVLGNTEEHLRQLLAADATIDLFLYDNGPDEARARFELRSAWSALSPKGVLLAHHIDANPAWNEFCRWQGLAPQVLDAGPPPMGGIGLRALAPSSRGA